ncbi:hypothetical protein D9M68_928990 [compost metagenome]
MDHFRKQRYVLPYPVIIGKHLSPDKIGQQGAHVGRDRHRRDGVQGAALGLKVGHPFGPLQGRQKGRFLAVAGVQRDVSAGCAVGLFEVLWNEDANVPT